jgi:PAS domain S-box-containing protein
MTEKPTYEELEQRIQALEQAESERKQVEQSLQFFECAVGASSDAIGMSTAEGNHWYQNKTFDDLFGDIGADPPASLYVDENQGRKVFQSIMAGNQWSGEVKMYGRGGKIVYIMLRAYSVKDKHGRILALVGVHTDITDRRKAEEALKKSEEKYRDLYDNSPDMHVSVDAKTANIIDCNQTTIKELGYTKEEIIGRSIFDMYTPDSAEYAKKNVFPVFAKDGKIRGAELQVQRKDRNTIDVSLNVSAVVDENDTILHSRSIWRDIAKQKQAEKLLQKAHNNLETQVKERTAKLTKINTQLQRELSNRRRAEEALRESESRYRLLAENVTDIIWTLDMNMNPTYYSPSITRLQGFTVEEALARSIEESMTPSSFDAASKVIAEEFEMLGKGQIPPDRSRKVDVEFYCKDGSTIWAEVEAGFLYDANGQPQGIIGVTRNITERKKAEDKLMRLHEELEKRVEKRTRDLAKINEVLEEKTIHLKEANTALKVLLKRRKEDQAEVEEKILANVNELIIPAIDTLKGTKLDDRQSIWIEILETNLRDIVSPFSRGLSSKYWKLTPMEFQVANFIKNGKTTKEISNLLHVAASTISTYRDNIREKLRIKNKKINLKTYLSDLE